MSSVSLGVWDQVVLACYAALVLGAGFLASRRASTGVQYLLAGRTLTLPLFVMTLVSTWYGGILGVGEFSYLYGLSSWITQGLPYYFFAALFALLLAGRIRRSGHLSIPDRLEAVYGRRAALAGSVCTFILASPAPSILMLGVLLHLVTGWGLLPCMAAGTVVSTLYLFLGGFRADVYTDAVEFVVMFLGFGAILPYAVSEGGGLEFLTLRLPPLHLTWHGGHGVQFIMVWFFIALWTLVDPSFHQRCLAAESEKTARGGILISIFFWFAFDAMTSAAGLYARALLPRLDQPMMAYPLLAEAILPEGVKGFFFAGLLATVMSTLNTTAFVSASTLGRDIVQRLRGRAGDDRLHAVSTRWGLCLTGLVSIGLAAAIPSVIRLWYTIGSAMVPGLLIPLVSSYFPGRRVGGGIALFSMLGGACVSVGWILAGAGSAPFLGVEPFYPGLGASGAVWVVGWVLAPAGPSRG
ncbi:MAG: sodium:solute symporter family protein [Bacteroidota bacterium]